MKLLASMLLVSSMLATATWSMEDPSEGIKLLSKVAGKEIGLYDTFYWLKVIGDQIDDATKY